MIETLDALDKELMLYLNYDGGSFLDQMWWIISGKFTWIPLYLYLLWQLVRRTRFHKTNWKPFAVMVVLTVMVIVLSDQISSGLIKPLVMRPRPSQPDSGISDLIHIVNGYRGGHYGFVSSHAANTWGIALWFILLLRNWRKELPTEQRNTSATAIYYGNITLLTLFAALNSYSRIYLGVHYPGDILGGLIVGTLVALFLYYMAYLPAKNDKLPFWKETFASIFEGSVGSL